MSDEELRELIRQSGEETRRHFDVVAEGLDRKNESVAEETRRHFGVVAEGLDRKIETVAEAVVRLDEKVDRVDSSIHDEMQRGFAETQAMIKFSYAELDRRLTTVEDDVVSLRKRVAQIESRQ